MRTILLLSSFIIISNLFGQIKKKIDVESYYKWKSIAQKSISTKGNYVAHLQKSYRGNDTLYIQRKSNWDTPIAYGRVKKFDLDFNERFVVFTAVNDYDSVRKLKLDEVPKKEWLKDSVVVFSFLKDTIFKFEETASYTIAKNGSDWLLIARDEGFELKKEEQKKKKCFLNKKKNESIDPLKNKGSVLTVFNIENQTTNHIEGVTEHALSDSGGSYAYVHSYTHNDTIDSAQLFVSFNGSLSKVYEIEGEIVQPTFNRLGTNLAFKISVDTGDYKKHQLYLFDLVNSKLNLVADTISDFFKTYQSVDLESKPSFSKDGTKLFYQLGIKPIEPAKDSLTKDEKYKLDLWNWNDGKLQPQQLLSAKKDAKGLVDVVYRIDDQKNVQLIDSASQSISYLNHKDSEYALIRDQEPYLKEMTWDFWYYDLYRVSLESGKKDLVYKKYHGWSSYLSPNGDQFCFFEPADSNWYCKNLKTSSVVNLTKTLDGDFYSRYHDVAQKIGPNAELVWVEGEQQVILKDHYDLWLVSLDGSKAERLTNGKEKGFVYSLLKLDEENDFVMLNEPIYVQHINDKTKSEGVSLIENREVKNLVSFDAKMIKITKAKESENVIFQLMTFEQYPDIYYSDLKFENKTKLTEANPQQKEYNWGTVEMVSWIDYKGDSVRGMLYKPEDFDPAKKYPMIVYFYERYTDRFHYYYRPKTTASIIYATEYVSNGYLVFIPDIAYEIGKPAQSAYNSIMSGTDFLIRNNNYIDSTRLGLQGQSWGGYQTAQLVTMTTRFKCGMAGAPVSNMFSAYGGMRWGSGLSRTFQYETGQSRIGATIWESPELYIENSPLFHLPKVETPLLIMHNDGDGAVPWYQGVELFNGLRRLGKPTWLLNYNDDEHNLMKEANRLDLSIRMRQFFDYYLLGSEKPEWMKEGIPAIVKGKENRY